MAFGDHIRAHRVGYAHDGIDRGDGTVIHLTATAGASKAAAVVQRTSLEEFRRGDAVSVVPYDPASRFPPEEVVRRAESYLDRTVGPDGYDLLQHNCEHFASWCVTGHYASEQVRRAAHLLGGSGTSAAIASGGIGVTSSLVASGISGAAQTTKALARVGGGSAADGALALAALPTAAAVIWFWSAMRDDPLCTGVERMARQRARGAAALAGILSLLGAGMLLYYLGRRGLSASGITSGLATMGSVVGGGMRAGVGVLGAGTSLASVLAGWYAYRSTGGSQFRP